MKIEQLLDTVASVMVDRAPEVIESTLTVTRFLAGREALLTMLCAGFTVWACKFVVKTWGRMEASDETLSEGVFFGSLFVGVSGLITMSSVVYGLYHIESFVGIFYPKLYLAITLVDKVVK